MNLNWLRRKDANNNQEKRTNSNPAVIDIENGTASMSFNDEEYAKALTNEQIEDCKEAFGIFVDEEGESVESLIRVEYDDTG